MATRTGSFPIGFRRGGVDWQKDLAALAGWAKGAGFEVLDLPKASPEDLATLKAAGLRIGTVDLLDWAAMLSTDAAKRKDAVARNTEFVKKHAAAGARLFFTIVMPEAPADPKEKRLSQLENYKLAVESYGALGQAAEQAGASVLIEGWPGGAGLPNLCCNPETTRALFRDTGTQGLGVNYDPSHLIRMGIDHVRFAQEFATRIKHIHAKDTEVFPEAVYEYGLYQPGVFAKGHRWGDHVWRYTLPGHGVARWSEIFKVLAEAGYTGAVSVELEDENFNGSEAGEKRALAASLAFLASA